MLSDGKEINGLTKQDVYLNDGSFIMIAAGGIYIFLMVYKSNIINQ